MEFFGVRLIGLTADSARKLLLTVALIVALVLLRALLGWVTRAIWRPHISGHEGERARFWTRQGVSLAVLLLLVAGVVSIWFDNPARFATMAGIITAGVAVALQRVITSFAAYLIILRGRVFTVGDRITMGGVRGDVVALGFMQTAVMEMGEPPPVQSAEPAVWVTARQYTGRIVRVTNDKIFDSPVYNYTREFPYLWEEIRLPVKYQADRARAESILLDAARRHTADIAPRAEHALAEMRRRYFLPEETALEPRVYYRLTDNWLELALRFVVPERGVRAIKDAMSRDILAALEKAGIEVASATYEIVGMPKLEVQVKG
ncbi:MAG TPA: mechanosensitive ion channel domain-containing protein [Gemmatimonadaceae bacterium]|nr:mechanosensitive ion channel domain-containing protein [Gemmatimonadaceae bacterium]